MTRTCGARLSNALWSGLVLLASLTGAVASAQMPEAAGKQAAPTLDSRVSDLVSKMTLEEKVSQLMNAAPAVPRLGIPAYNWWNEALHGVARAGHATVFPQAIGLAATWDEPLMRQVATTISTQARAKYNVASAKEHRGLYEGLTFWSPNINIFRDPRWGRGMETYGEDPYLAGRLAVAFVQGMQGKDPRYLKTVATPKHYAVHSGPEPDRHTFDAKVDEVDLRDTYLPQFEMAVREGGALSVMCSYNRVDGDPACASPRLLTDILRKEWGFGGYVVSDCGAIWDIYTTHKTTKTAEEASALAVKAGCDLECGDSYKSLVEAVKKGLLTEADIDQALRRLFTIRFRLGMFDPQSATPWGSLGVADIETKNDEALALRTAAESLVLLKNDNRTLPLSKEVKTLAVIGPNADDSEVLLGNYNGSPAASVTVLEGIKRVVGAGTKVLYARGSDWAEGLAALDPVPATVLSTTDGGKKVPGLKAEYFNNKDLTGTPAFVRVDPTVNFSWGLGKPDPRIKDEDAFSIRWMGELTVPTTGTYNIGGYGFDTFKIFLDGKPLVSFHATHEPTKTVKPVKLSAGRRYRIRIDYTHGAREAFMQLLWGRPGLDLASDALKAAREADAVVMVLGLSPRLEGEEMDVKVPGFKGGDRTDINLPAPQQRLLEQVMALGKPTTLVLLNGSALGVTWADEHVPAILEAWYPGQAAGTAVAAALFGDVNPGGRLPVTFYRSIDQLPAFAEYKMAGRTYRYFKGLPLYPFGHGLSYTQFGYANLSVPSVARAGEDVSVSVDVTNTGKVAGDEVVQAYVSHPGSQASAPIRALAGFQRVTLTPGETRKVSFKLLARQLALTGADGKPAPAPGPVTITVGGKQPGMTGTVDASATQAVAGTVEIK